jgi:hypothetical protein
MIMRDNMHILLDFYTGYIDQNVQCNI